MIIGHLAVDRADQGRGVAQGLLRARSLSSSATMRTHCGAVRPDSEMQVTSAVDEVIAQAGRAPTEFSA